MRKIISVFMLFLAALTFFTYGCGGSGGDNASSDDSSGSQESLVANDAYYVPIELTHEELVALARTLVPLESFDLSWAEQQDNASASSLNASESASSRRSVMWQHAVKMVFSPDLVGLNGNFMNHGSTAEKTRQYRFLYVYLEYPDYKDERETLLNYQYRGSTASYKWNSRGCSHDIMGTDCVGFVYQCAYEATKSENVTVTNRQGQKVDVKVLRMRH